MSKVSYGDNEQIINFNDAVIYGSDFKIVKSSTHWLNDGCIHFYMKVLQNRIQQQSPNKDDDQILFMDPSVVSFFMHQCCDDEDFEDFKEGTKFPRHGYCFIPVNDAMRSSNDGNYYWSSHTGTHWSLLVVVVIRRNTNNAQQECRFEFWHFDSVANSGNSFAAQDIAKKLSKVLFPPPSHPPLSSTTNNVHKNDDHPVVLVHEANTPQQKNGYDCGIYMLAATKLLSTSSLNDGFDNLQVQERKLRQFVKENPDFCKLLRQEIVQEILDKARNQ